MKKSVLNKLIPAIAVLFALIMSGCGGEDDLVLARIGDAKIMSGDLDDIFKRNRRFFQSFEEELESRRNILDSLIIQQLLIREAYKMNIDELEEVNRIVLANKDKFLLDILYQRKVADPVIITEDDIKDFYSKLEYKVHAFHILVSDEDTANMIIDSLQNGASFENLAVEYSLDPSAQSNRGDLGYFVWGQMDPVFQEQVFKMSPDQISKPFKTRFGWHIVKMVDRAPNELLGSYEKMYDQIDNSLQGAGRSKRLEKYRDELLERYAIRIDTITCEYLMHKRASLYPPSLLETLPKNDFDLSQLDRDEKELILASWDGGQVTMGQYLSRISKINPRFRPDLDDYEGLAEFAFQLEFEKILSVEARRSGMEDDPEFKRKLKKFKELTMADIMENDSIPYPEEPDEDEIRQYYDNHPEEFLIPEKIHIYEIMFNDHSLAETYAHKTRSLQKFKAVASQYTERSGKRTTSGDLGWIEERSYPRLFAAAKETDVGRVAGPITLAGKYSIIYVAEKRPEQVKDFLMVKQNIKETLGRQRRTEGFEDWVAEKKAEVDIEIYENNIRAGINKARYAVADSTAG